MPLIRRRLLNFLALVCLPPLVLSATVAVYGQFFSKGGTFGPQNELLSFRVGWRNGGFSAYWCRGTAYRWSASGPYGALAGVIYRRGYSSDGKPVYITAASQAHVWILALVSAVAPALSVRRTLRELRRPRPGACARCGYDLRATPDRCPECGAAPQDGAPTPHHAGS
jgi:hypothetical protein